jgi:acyl-CoA reductase-like NAD-dependent aldehyde dehydrogenase
MKSSADSGFRKYPNRSYRERAQILLKAGEIVERDAEHFGRIMTRSR